MSAPSPQCACCTYVPKEDLFVTTNGGEFGIIACDSKVEDFIAVGTVRLNEARKGLGSRSFGGVVEMDSPIRGAGQNLEGR